METFKYGVNVVGFVKNEIRYGMTCSWAMQADFDKVLLLLGEQSITGKNIHVGDTIGVSSLAKGQKDIAMQLGNFHSNVIDKYKGIDYSMHTSAIMINNAKIKMVVEVIDVMHLDQIEESNLIYGSIVIMEVDEEVDFLSSNDLE